MGTISERLRKEQRVYDGVFRYYPDGRTEGPFHPDMLEAADVIDDLVAALERVRSLNEAGGDAFSEPGRVVLNQIDAALSRARTGS